MELTELQKDIIAKVIEGKCNGDIAEQLHHSKGKIQKELRKIYKILNIKNDDSNAKRAILVREIIKLEFANFMM